MPVETVRTVTEQVKDTVKQVELVPYYTERETPSGKSYLENDYAYSDAEWDGTALKHTLGIKEGARVEVPVQEKITTETVTEPTIVEVEKKLSKAEQFYVDNGLRSIILNIVLFSLVLFLLVRRTTESG